MSIQIASLAAFGVVWLLQFLLLERVLFRPVGSTVTPPTTEAHMNAHVHPTSNTRVVR